MKVFNMVSEKNRACHRMIALQRHLSSDAFVTLQVEDGKRTTRPFCLDGETKRLSMRKRAQVDGEVNETEPEKADIGG